MGYRGKRRSWIVEEAMMYLSLIAWALMMILVLWGWCSAAAKDAEPEPEQPVEEAIEVAVEPEPVAVVEEILVCAAPAPEPEPEVVFGREDVPLEPEVQMCLYEACEESGVEFELMLGLIEKETTFRNVIGDGGDSYGYCQIQKRWHEARMEKLGVTDLMDPASNFRVGCDYLAELMSKYPLERALTAYNRGTPGKSRYAKDVLENYERWCADG